jgi:LPS export ABC transporter permease LptF
MLGFLKIYQLYLAANFITPFLVSTTFFVAFLLTFEMFRVMQMLTASDISIWFIMGMMGNIAITLVPMAIPLSIYFSSIFCLSRMSGDSEYIALRSFGVDKKKLLIPFMIIAFFVSVNVFFLNQELIPNAHRKVRMAFKKISSTSLIEGIKSGQFFTTIPNITLFPASVDEKTKELEDVFLQIYDSKLNTEKVIFADKGQILYAKNEETGIESFKLFLKNGNIFNINQTGKDTEKILFEEYLLPISEKRFSYRTTTKEVMMNHHELRDFINAGLDAALKKKYKKKDYFNAQYEYWNRMNTPLLCILLTFIGFGLGVKGNRSRGKNNSGRAILILIGYYIFFFSMISVCREGIIPLYVGLFVPAIALLGLGIRFYKKLDWQG